MYVVYGTLIKYLYCIGFMENTNQAKAVLGGEKLACLDESRTELDPRGLLDPHMS